MDAFTFGNLVRYDEVYQQGYGDGLRSGVGISVGGIVAAGLAAAENAGGERGYQGVAGIGFQGADGIGYQGVSGWGYQGLEVHVFVYLVSQLANVCFA